METRKKWTILGASTLLGVGAAVAAVSSATAFDLDRSDDVVPVPGIQVGDDRTVSPIPSASSPAVDAPVVVTPPAPAAPAPSTGDSANSPVSPASPASPASAPSAASAGSAGSAD